MTSNQALRILDVFAAFSHGKSVQYSIIGRNEWVDDLNPDFSVTKDWRIKPELKVVPFTFEDNLLFRDRWIYNKTNKLPGIMRIISYNDMNVHVESAAIGYQNLLMNFEFEDGSPCGKYINEYYE